MQTETATQIATRLTRILGRAEALKLCTDMANRPHTYTLRERVRYSDAAKLIAE